MISNFAYVTMIYGIGTDILQISRIAKIKNLERFAKKILGINEYNIYNTFSSDDYKIRYLAKRFCMKEAILKSYGIGIGGKYKLNEIEILNDQSGKPFTIFLNKDTNKQCHISTSDEKEYVVAFSVIESI